MTKVASEECSEEDLAGSCLVSDNLLHHFENVEYNECLILCHTVEACQFVTWTWISQQCYLLSSCDNVSDCGDCISSNVCPGNSGFQVQIDSDQIGITIRVDNQDWMR